MFLFNASLGFAKIKRGLSFYRAVSTMWRVVVVAATAMWWITRPYPESWTTRRPMEVLRRRLRMAAMESWPTSTTPSTSRKIAWLWWPRPLSVHRWAGLVLPQTHPYQILTLQYRPHRFVQSMNSILEKNHIQLPLWHRFFFFKTGDGCPSRGRAPIPLYQQQSLDLLPGATSCHGVWPFASFKRNRATPLCVATSGCPRNFDQSKPRRTRRLIRSSYPQYRPDNTLVCQATSHKSR